jgi:histidinol-phosphate/aromatic aminotransferase/cobyric acid decarboxylase-like protein
VRAPGYLDRRRRYISDERDRLFAVLSTLPGVVPWPSETNFITIDVTATGRPSSDYVAEAKAEHLLLRRVAAHRLEGQYVRVTIGTIDENDRFLEVFSRSVPGAETPGADAAAR